MIVSKVQGLTIPSSRQKWQNRVFKMIVLQIWWVPFRTARKLIISMKRVAGIWGFFDACKSYVYTILWSTECAIALCLKKVYTSI